MREEFAKLEALLGELDKPDSLQAITQVLSEAMHLFEKLKDVVRTGTPEEKNEMVRFMNKINELIKKQFELSIKKAGLTEEQFVEISNNPDYFTPEQWQKMQENKKQLAEKNRELYRVIMNAETLLKDREQKALKTGPKAKKAPVKSKTRPAKKRWMKS